MMEYTRARIIEASKRQTWYMQMQSRRSYTRTRTMENAKAHPIAKETTENIVLMKNKNITNIGKKNIVGKPDTIEDTINQVPYALDNDRFVLYLYHSSFPP